MLDKRSRFSTISTESETPPETIQHVDVVPEPAVVEVAVEPPVEAVVAVTPVVVSDAPIELAEEDPEDIREEIYSAEQDLSFEEENSLFINTAVVQLESLAETVNDIVVSGRATRASSRLVDMQVKNIAEPFGFNSDKYSLENYNEDHITHLNASSEGIINVLERFSQAKLINNKRIFFALAQLLRRNSSLLVSYSTKLAKLDGIVRGMKNGPESKIDFSYSGVGRYFLVHNTNGLPDFKEDLSLTKYIVNDYYKVVADAISKLETLIKSSDLTTEEGKSTFNKALAKIQHPGTAFKESFFGKTYFGENVLLGMSKQSVNPDRVVDSYINIKPVRLVNKSSNLIRTYETHGGSLNPIIDIVIGAQMMESPAVNMTVNDFHNTIKIGTEYSHLLFEANKKVKTMEDTSNSLYEAIASSPKAKLPNNKLISLADSFVNCYKYPMKEDVTRGIKTVQKLSSVLEVGIKNSPWKNRLIW